MTIYNIVLNIAMENGPFLDDKYDDLPIKHRDFIDVFNFSNKHGAGISIRFYHILPIYLLKMVIFQLAKTSTFPVPGVGSPLQRRMRQAKHQWPHESDVINSFTIDRYLFTLLMYVYLSMYLCI